MPGGIERKRELRRRRSRAHKVQILKRKLKTASTSEKAVIATKLRRLTPGAEVIIVNVGIAER